MRTELTKKQLALLARMRRCEEEEVSHLATEAYSVLDCNLSNPDVDLSVLFHYIR